MSFPFVRDAAARHGLQHANWERSIETKGGMKIYMRSIRPDDAPLLLDFFHNLSRRSIYYRFFGLLKTLLPDMLNRFTQIDERRDIALIALDQPNPGQKLLGVARIMGDPEGKRGELAVVVGDPWQGKGIGAALMGRLLAVAKEKGLESLWGVVLAENTQMLAMCRKMKFEISKVPIEGQYQVKIDLRNLSFDRKQR